MGKDSPIELHSQDLRSDKIEDVIINEKHQFKNNSSGKGNKCQFINDLYKDDRADTRTIETYDKHDWKSYTHDSDKEVVTLKNDQSLVSNDGRQKSLPGAFFASASRKGDCQDSFHVLKHHFKLATTSKSGSDLKIEPHTKHDSSNISAIDLELTEKPSTVIDTRSFQKEDCPQEFEITKDVASRLDKCSWDKESEQEIIDEKSSSNEDDTVTVDLSTSDIFSEEMEDLASKSSGSHCDDISIVQTSDGSASGSEDTEGSSTEDDCDSDIEENNGDSVFIVDINGQQAPVVVIVDIVEENDQLVENEDDDIDITQESVCEDRSDDELSGTDQPDIVSPQNKQLVVQPFYPSLDSAALIDHQTAKHHMLTNTGYNTEIVGDTADLVIVNNVQIEIPPIQDNVNPLLPVQNARSQDNDDDVDGQSLLDGQLENNSTDQTDNVEYEQAEDLPVSNSSLSMSLESPQVIGGSPIHSFSTSSEDPQYQHCNILEESDVTETDSEYSEQSDCWLISSLSDLAASVGDQDEHLDIT